ncbi:Usp family protein [Arthrobacter crystallopoietes BAB-32]|uniref:Usp family protein n=1 Tax=Arthrobacter crystallopoietes BAB-32 TaxID=1246476 RepID=N1VD48_9MICC|nr:universal stress protein [Arthrobacter crystallopoietes]EMY36223.1 Usp family protein [Arthrobacter crystallopoietes BAB-32]
MSVAVGFVPTEEGRAALDAAIDEAVLRGTDLRILGPGQAENTHDAQEELARLLERAEAAGVRTKVRQMTSDDDPGDLIVDVSYEDDVELVVIGVRRRSRVGKLLLGSTAQRVILEAGCAVHAVKPPVGPHN